MSDVKQWAIDALSEPEDEVERGTPAEAFAEQRGEYWAEVERGN